MYQTKDYSGLTDGALARKITSLGTQVERARMVAENAKWRRKGTVQSMPEVRANGRKQNLQSELLAAKQESDRRTALAVADSSYDTDNPLGGDQ